jgi:hypothetical protein
VSDEREAEQWPPARGLPGQRRYKRASQLNWGETPFDDLDRAELLRLVQAYHAAAVSARGVLHLVKIKEEDNPFWGRSGSGGRALAGLEYLIFRSGDGKANGASEKIYRSFFRQAYGLLFPAIAEAEDLWGIDDTTGHMFAPFKPGERAKFGGEGKLRALKWSDLLPRKAGDE